jgi:ABC-type lipoprotein release transport system permease subunit
VTIVGIAADVVYDVRHRSKLVVYLPVSQYTKWLGTRARVLVDANDVGEARRVLSRSLSNLDPQVTPVSVRTIEEMLRSQYAFQDLAGQVMTVLGALSLCLSMIGVHSLLSLVIALRRRELAIRAALGATGMQIAKTLSVSIGGPVVVGSAIGVLGLWMGSRIVIRHIVGMKEPDVAALLLAPVAMVCLTLAVCLRLIWATAATEPQTVLRRE